MTGASGSNRVQDKDQPSSSLSPTPEDDSGAPKILVIEDNAGDVVLIRKMLRHHEIQSEVVAIRDGEAALDYLGRYDSPTFPPVPELVILDLNLPKIHGTAVLQYIRSNPSMQQVPVVVLSSSDTISERQNALNLGANDYIAKPQDLEAFLEIGGTIKRLLKPTEPQ
jgi:DNA-binding response OmpR family regulator